MKRLNPYTKLAISFTVSAWIVFTASLGYAQITISKTDALCNGNNGSASASVNHGTPPYTYKWSNGSSSAGIDHLAPGTYTVEVRDAVGCTGSKSVVIENSVPDLDVNVSGGGSVPFCVQDGPPVITLSASVSGGTPPYIWAPASSLSVSGSGTYSFSVKDSNKCKGKKSVIVTYIPIRCSRDPNEIIGPVGYGDPQFITTKSTASYLINFENDPDFATAPAQKVVVSYDIDPHMSLSSVKLGDFGFGNLVFTVPANTSNYSARLDLIDSLGVLVDVTAGINVGNNTVFWIFQSIDPATGLPPEDPMMGFLPVNDSVTHNGEGYVSFSVKPKTTTLTGDSLLADAVIVFDINPPLPTNTWLNIADALPPVSQVAALPASFDSTNITITVSGSDDTGGSGIASFDLYVSENQGNYQKYGTALWNESLLFTGKACTQYAFFSIAKDHTGNTEAMKTTGETTTWLQPEPEITQQPVNQQVFPWDPLSFSLTATGVTFYRWEMSTDGGITFNSIDDVTPFSGATTNTLQISVVNPDFNGLKLRCLASNGGCYVYSDTVVLSVISALSGTLLYDNILHSPLNNTLIMLKTLNGNTVDSAYTNPSGSFLFTDIEPGNYIVEPDIQKVWGGANAADALLALRQFTGLTTLTGLKLEAADVNASGHVNAIDALLIARRFVQSVDTFAAGDWVFIPDTVMIDLISYPVSNFVTLCYGDVDASYIPGLKIPPLVTLVPGLEMKIQSDQQFTLPLTVSKDLTAGAVSLVLHYPGDYLQLIDIECKTKEATNDLLFTHTADQIRVAWYSTTPMFVDMGEPLLKLTFRASDRPLDGNLDIYAESSSEVDDKLGKPIKDVKLYLPRLVSTDQPATDFLGQNYPNPCNSSTEITYFLTEDAFIELGLFNTMGQTIKILESGYKMAGHHKALFNSAGLSPGNYPYRLEIRNSQINIRLFHIMTISN